MAPSRQVASPAQRALGSRRRGSSLSGCPFHCTSSPWALFSRRGGSPPEQRGQPGVQWSYRAAGLDCLSQCGCSCSSMNDGPHDSGWACRRCRVHGEKNDRFPAVINAPIWRDLWRQSRSGRGVSRCLSRAETQRAQRNPGTGSSAFVAAPREMETIHRSRELF